MSTSNDFPQKAGQFIRATRRKLGVSQDSFASQIGCSHATLSALENGKAVSSHTLLKALSELGIALQLQSEAGSLCLPTISNENAPAAPNRESVIQTIQETAEDFPAIKRAFLFGSFARNDFNGESDVDIRIEIADDTAFNLHDLVHFSKSIERKTGREVDVISAREIKNAQLKKAIDRDKVLAYDRENN